MYLSKGSAFGRVKRHVWKAIWFRFGKVLSYLTFFDKSAGGFSNSEVTASLRAHLAFNANPYLDGIILELMFKGFLGALEDGSTE